MRFLTSISLRPNSLLIAVKLTLSLSANSISSDRRASVKRLSTFCIKHGDSTRDNRTQSNRPLQLQPPEEISFSFLMPFLSFHQCPIRKLILRSLVKFLCRSGIVPLTSCLRSIVFSYSFAPHKKESLIVIWVEMKGWQPSVSFCPIVKKIFLLTWILENKAYLNFYSIIGESL